LWVFTLISPKRPLDTWMEAIPVGVVAKAGTTISAATRTSAPIVASARWPRGYACDDVSWFLLCACFLPYGQDALTPYSSLPRR
jgi:hypothetical protein